MSASKTSSTGQELPPHLRTVSAYQLAEMLGKTAHTVYTDLTRAPDRLPAPIRVPGARVIWLESTVLAWLQSHQVAPAASAVKRGRPTKVQQQARARREAAAATSLPGCDVGGQPC